MAFEAIPKSNIADLVALDSINTYIHAAKNGGRMEEWVNKKNRNMESFFRVMMPYCLNDGVLLNREYMPLGVSSRYFEPKWFDRKMSKLARESFIKKLKENGLYDHVYKLSYDKAQSRNIEDSYYFFRDSTNPMAKVSTKKDFLNYRSIVELLIESLEASTTQTVKQKNAYS